MNLAQQIQAFKNNAPAKPAEVTQTMQQATQDLIETGIENNAPKVGELFPNFALPNQNGDNVELSTLLEQGSVVLSFYRGGWCPYCNLELAALQKKLPEFKAKNAHLVAISPEQPDHSLSTIEKNELAFPVLTDEGNAFANKLGLVFTLPIEIQKLYAQFGIDVVAHNGDETFELPLPATFVIGQDGNVQYAFVKADYTQRAEPDDVLSALN